MREYRVLLMLNVKRNQKDINTNPVKIGVHNTYMSSQKT